ncbi:YidC/Oxa1 family membrane protein insertase [Patescibacteria group bacterium]
MVNFFNTFFYNPVYNGLVFLLSTFSWMDLGVAVIFLTIIIRLILLPLAKKSIQTQISVKKIEPKLNEIKERLKDDKEKQAREIMDLYRNEKINPFSSFFLVLIQIPVLLSLYFVLLKGGLPEINSDILYSFVNIPENIKMSFLGLVDITKGNLLLAFLTGLSQYFQIKLMSVDLFKNKKSDGSFKGDLMKSMQFQMQFVMPIIIFFISYTLPSVIALYWTTSNIFMMAQEILIKRRMLVSEDNQINHG